MQRKSFYEVTQLSKESSRLISLLRVFYVLEDKMFLRLKISFLEAWGGKNLENHRMRKLCVFWTSSRRHRKRKWVKENFMSPLWEKHFQSNRKATIRRKCVLKIYSCDNAHHVIYDDFSVTQNRRRETSVPYLKRNGRKLNTLFIKASEIETFSLVRTFTISYNAMVIGRPRTRISRSDNFPSC